ncbi:MAG: DNA primase [Omnitrophica bacterium RIFCSPLOWO2_12_FULL_44_17]|uniref:DNA primase n=1 Tax=Candidatus Danuiimicrobium aquiferis TaxID=1801832 RepID=A0A1G1L2Z3_9BACT|nr:MAG: DNA primase [Omnitrophica bacterium RIFCSPHIGHO2_02_FULL_45_28]OGW99506.1 MAG: DNA primase [Omnitrophica bacterium RIFCSPLOWO2_12_FULL_44_17]OGX02679.1 MAG: DNA primase [Omnitrophica bacterium RIFCSPLOWO2_02_FULL_44_11]
MNQRDPIVDQIQLHNDIVEIVSGYIPLKRAGRNFKARCPFHQEKTPSFTVNPDKQIFHCFGCGVGGDVFSFLMKYEQLTFPEALIRLAERAHIQLPERKNFSPEAKSETDTLYRIYAEAAQFYHQYFKHPETGKKARAYFENRKFTDQEVEKFQIGYAVTVWRGLFEYLSKKGFPEKNLLQSGLIVRSEKAETPFDLFRDRIMFPIWNNQGKVIAMGGRIMGEGTPKYINSPESPIFKKRSEMYGLHFAKKAIAMSGEIRQVLIVEGYLDCIRLHSSGFENAVATLGTALTSDHVPVLKRYADEAIVIYDGDRAGEEAALRGLEVFLEGEMNVKVLRMPEGDDPDSFIRTNGKEAMAELIQKSQDIFDFKMDSLSKRFNRTDSLGLMKITRSFFETFLKMKSPVLLDRYMKKLAFQLGIQEAALRKEFETMSRRVEKPDSYGQNKTSQTGAKKSVRAIPKLNPEEQPGEILLLSLLLQYPPYVDPFRKRFPGHTFANEKNKKILQTLEELIERNNQYDFPPAMILNRFAEENMQRYAVELLSKDWDSVEKRDQAFQDCLNKIDEISRQEKLQNLRNDIARAEAGGNPETLFKAMKAYEEYLHRS